MRIALVTMMYGRHEIFQIFAKQFEYLRDNCSEELVCVCVGSDGMRGQTLCDKHGIYYHNFPNHPLGRKANKRLEIAQSMDVDAVLFAGSDDLISLNDLEYKIKKLKEGFNFIAPMDIYYYDYRGGGFYYSNGYNGTARAGEPMAVGRMLSREVMDKLKWNLFPSGKKRGLDGAAKRKLATIETKKHFYYHSKKGTMVVDIKSGMNMNSMSKIISRCTNSNINLFNKHYAHLEINKRK